MGTSATGWLQVTGCPECANPAEVVARHVLGSTGGPVEHAHVRCIDGHVFNLPVHLLAAAGPRRDRARPSSRGARPAG